MLTVETEVNVDSKNANGGGPFMVGSLDLSCRYKRFLFCLSFSSQTSIKFFPHHMSPILIPLTLRVKN
jgi:hypothetical protein